MKASCCVQQCGSSDNKCLALSYPPIWTGSFILFPIALVMSFILLGIFFMIRRRVHEKMNPESTSHFLALP